VLRTAPPEMPIPQRLNFALVVIVFTTGVALLWLGSQVGSWWASKAGPAADITPIKQVAWECGFETPAAFSAAFRRVTGYRPRDYRQLLTS